MILRPGECVGPETKRERFFRGILISGPAEDRLRRRGNTLLSFLFPLTFFFFSLHPSPLASRRFLARETQPGNNQSLPPPNSNPLERTHQVSPRIFPRETSTNDRRHATLRVPGQCNLVYKVSR